ncbi:hypothetical protein Q3G72_026291 [Acer saccharum]|nr:hypothetical protein Q3G72_026291 [Acer saccharum]
MVEEGPELDSGGSWDESGKVSCDLSDDEGEYGSNQMGKVQKETQLEEAGPQRRIEPFLSTREDLMMVTTFGSTVSRAGPYGGPW